MIFPPNQASHSICVPSLASSERYMPLWLSFFQLLNLSNPSLVVWRFHTKEPVNFQLYTRSRAQFAPLQTHPCLARQSSSTPVLRNLPLTATGQRLKRLRIAQIHVTAHENIMPLRYCLQHAQRELVREARLCAHHHATSPITTFNHDAIHPQPPLNDIIPPLEPAAQERPRRNAHHPRPLVAPAPPRTPPAPPLKREALELRPLQLPAPLLHAAQRGEREGHVRADAHDAVRASAAARLGCAPAARRRSARTGAGPGRRRRRGGVLARCGRRRRRTSARSGEARSESRTVVVGVAATMTLLLVAVVLASRLRRGA